MQIQSREPLDPEVVALIMAQQRELADSGVIPGPDSEHFLVAVVGGHAVGCAAWQPTDDGAELRWLYVRPSFRNREIDAALTMALEAQAPART